MKNKGIIWLAGFLLAGLLIAVSFLGGVVAGDRLLPGFTFKQDSAVAAALDELPLPASSIPPNGMDKLFKPFWQAWNIVHDQYIDQPVDDVALMHGAIRGMMEALGDQHTSYMDPDEYRQLNISMDGEYEGIGAWVDPTAEYLTIISPMPDSPAEKAGLQAGDQIIKIDGTDMTGIDGNLVIKKVLGPAGSKVVLTINREEVDKPFDVEIVRAKVTVPSVEGKILEEDKDIAYVQLSTFGETTERDLHKTLKDLLAKKPKGLILDLRNNGGGYLDTAIDVASEFVDQGVVLYEDYGDGRRDTYKSKGNGLATEIPMVVLINEGSASASEIVAGAIQDHKRGPLVGVTSFGKGSVQNWIPLSDNQGAVRVTIARWLTPDEKQIHKKGLTPDVEIQFSEDDVKAKKDVQLEKAIEVLKKEMK